MQFRSFSFDSKISAGIDACNFTQPTPIQEQAIPLAQQGHDIMGLAQTGTGKTAAFVLPILEKLMTGPRRKPRALIVAPTRELAEQTVQAFKELGRHTGLRAVAIYGGVSKFAQVKAVRSGAEILVACPGRLLDHLQDKTFGLKNIEVLILDEADRMLDMGFLPDIRRILSLVPQKRQTMLFSATMPSEIHHLADEILNQPKIVRIGEESPAPNIDQILCPVESQRKTTFLLHLLKSNPQASTLIFTRTKHGAKKLARTLCSEGYRSTDLQGNLSQSKRQAALDGFRRGKFNVLVATDIAARGIDVTAISQVVNYDMPDTTDAYTHRIGRTGRADQQGQAFSLVLRTDMPLVRRIERSIGRRLQRQEFTPLSSPTSGQNRKEKRPRNVSVHGNGKN